MIEKISTKNKTGFYKDFNSKQTKVFSSRPHSFVDLMEMYELNYIRLRLFCGDIRDLPDESISTVEGSVPIKLTVLERSKHTTLLMLTYLFESDKRPDLKIQVYHDSRQANVLSRSCQIKGREIRLWEKQVDTILLCRWRLNRFLYKWLNYLDHKGHDFQSETLDKS